MIFIKNLIWGKFFLGTLFGVLITTMTYNYFGDILFNLLGYTMGYIFIAYGMENLIELYKNKKYEKR